jgi:hypothetical protein
MNQFYLYDNREAGAYNRARPKPVQGLYEGFDWRREYFFLIF